MKRRIDRCIGIAVSLAAGLLLHAPARATEFQVSGLLDVVAAERGTAYDTNLLTRGDSQFDAYGLRFFVNAQVSDRLQVYSQFVLRDATSPYVDGAYLQFTPSPTRDLHVIAGKVPWPIGTFAPRTYSNHNPLIGAPLMYQYHTTLLWYEAVPSADVLLAASGSGQYGVDYFGYAEGFGVPIVDDSYWDVGVTLNGSARPLEYALGVSAGTPGWGSTSQDENTGKSVLGRLGLAPLPGLRFGVSGSYGPYLVEALNPGLPAGHRANDYHQQLAMADLEILAGHLELRGEAAHSVWETPFVGDLSVQSAYGEIKYLLPVGAYLAGRYDVQRFSKIRDSGGVEHPWDADVTRYEAGAGYRFNRAVIAKLVYQHTDVDRQRVVWRAFNPAMVAAQISVAF